MGSTAAGFLQSLLNRTVSDFSRVMTTIARELLGLYIHPKNMCSSSAPARWHYAGHFNRTLQKLKGAHSTGEEAVREEGEEKKEEEEKKKKKKEEEKKKKKKKKGEEERRRRGEGEEKRR